MTSLKKLTLKGFKSIESLDDFEFRPLNVLIGANGAGKSNLIDFFRMLRAMAKQSFQKFVQDSGGADGFFYLGPKRTRQIMAHVTSESPTTGYAFTLSTTPSGEMRIHGECKGVFGGYRLGFPDRDLGENEFLPGGELESSLPILSPPRIPAPGVETIPGKKVPERIWRLVHDGKTVLLLEEFSTASKTSTRHTLFEAATEADCIAEIRRLGLKPATPDGRGIPELAELSRQIYLTILSWAVYHFHDTSIYAQMRRDQSVRDFDALRPDGSNIAVFLLHLRETQSAHYNFILDTVRSIAPFFQDFMLRPEKKGLAELVRLEWRQKGSDFPFQPWQLSDGMIRFICLATALLQPRLPALIVIDEPELGLHPSAVSLVANMIQSASHKTQIIVSTQSPALVDCVEPEDVVVVDRERGHSLFRRLNTAELAEWLEEYSLGELWWKGVLSGGPAHE